MRKVSLIIISMALIVPGGAVAQEPAADAAPAAPVASAPDPALTAEPEPAVVEEAPVEEEEAPVEEEEAPVEEEEAPAEEASGGLSFSAFADAHYALQTSKSGSAIAWHRAYAGASPSGEFDAMSGSYVGYANDNGFALNFAGIDAAYDGGEYGATLSLRFGPKMGNYHFNSDLGYARGSSTYGIENLTQAYGTWAPTDALSIDVGMFGTIFGAEVLESWQNLNYSRGALYFAAQPFWHTGVRAGYAFSDMVSVTAMVVNDANTTWNTPNNSAPDIALQLGLAPVDGLSIAAGGMFAIDDETASGIETFFDLVVSYETGDFTAILNADYSMNRESDAAADPKASVMGGSLALGYAFTPMFRAAIRGEHLIWGGALENALEPLTTATLTLDLRPSENDNLIIRAEGRHELATDAFVDSDGDLADNWSMGTLSLVVTTD